MVLDPRAGKPRRYDVTEAPIGEIRVRQDGGGGSRGRFIKVAMRGPSSVKWRPYARWWWEQNRGPIPVGKVVIHLDGDRLNDAPENLAIGTTDDALFIAHSTRPGCNDSQLRRERTREFNVARARLRRLAGPLASAWYLVDVERRRIWNTGDHTRWDALERVGVLVPAEARANGRGVAAACLGWPGLWSLEAAVLAALADAGEPVATEKLYAAAALQLAHYGHAAPAARTTWYSIASRLARRGFIARQRRGSLGALVDVTPEGLTARGRTTRLLAVRSDQLGAYAGFAWVTERGQEYQREAALDGAARLLEEVG